MSVVIVPEGFGAFVFDAVLSEVHEHTNEPTEFPVELGVDITDHIRVKPDVFTVTGLVSQTPAFAAVGSIEAPLELDAEIYVPPFYQQLSAVATALLGGPPNPVVTATQFPAEIDYLSDAHAYFLALKTSRVLSEVTTSTVVYTDMAVTSVAVNKKEPGSIELTVAFKQITTVTTSTVAAPKPTIPAGSPKVSTGAQGTTETPAAIQNSAAKSIVNLAQGKPANAP